MEKEKFWENSMYAVIVLLVIGQMTVGWLFYVGQGAYLIGNIINVLRDFKMNRPKADKIKNLLFTAITIGLIMLRMLNVMQQKINTNYLSINKERKIKYD